MANWCRCLTVISHEHSITWKLYQIYFLLVYWEWTDGCLCLWANRNIVRNFTVCTTITKRSVLVWLDIDTHNGQCSIITSFKQLIHSIRWLLSIGHIDGAHCCRPLLAGGLQLYSILWNVWNKLFNVSSMQVIYLFMRKWMST